MQIVDYGFSVAIRGNIDRETGRMDATLVISDPTQQPHDPNTATIHYELVCKETRFLKVTATFSLPTPANSVARASCRSGSARIIVLVVRRIG